MDFNRDIRPYKRRVMAESFIRATVFGVFFGLCATLVASLVFRALPENWYAMQTNYLLIAILSGVGVALVSGLIIYIFRYRRGVGELNRDTAKRMDKLGNDERFITALELKDESGVMAKLQREDAQARLGKMQESNQKIKISLPKRTLAACLAILIALLLVFNIYADEPNPYYKDAQDIVIVLDDILDKSDLNQAHKDTIEEILKEFEESIHEEMTKEEILESPQNLKDKANEAERLEKQKRDELLEAMKEDELMKDLADAIESQDPDKIKDAIEDLKEKIEEQPTEQEKMDMAEPIQDSLEKIIEKSPDSAMKDALEQAKDDLDKVIEELEKIDQEKQEIQEEIDKTQEELDKTQEELDKIEEENAPDEETPVYRMMFPSRRIFYLNLVKLFLYVIHDRKNFKLRFVRSDALDLRGNLRLFQQICGNVRRKLVVKLHPRISRNFGKGRAEQNLVTAIHTACEFSFLGLCKIHHCLQLVFQCYTSCRAKILIGDIGYHGNSKNQPFQAFKQVLLRPIGGRLAHKLCYDFGSVVTVCVEIHNAVIPYNADILRFNLCAQNFQVGIREVVNIIRFFRNGLVIGIDHRQHRLKNALPLVVFYILGSGNTVKEMAIPVIVKKLCAACDLKMPHTVLVGNAAFFVALPVFIDPDKIKRSFDDGIIIDHKGFQRGKIRDTEFGFFVPVIHLEAMTENRTEL